MRRTSCLSLLLAFALTGGAFADRLEKRLEARPGQTLEIDLRTGGTITVVPGDDTAVVVTVERREIDAIDVTIEPSSRGVRVESRYHGRRQNDNGNLEIEARVPRHSNVQVSTMGGDVRLEGLEGRFSGSTMGGEIQLTDLTGDADLSTMGGNIRVQRSRLDGSVSTMGGTVRIQDNRGNLKGSSMGGAVSYKNSGPDKGTPGEAGGPIVMSSMGGDVNVDDAPQGAELSTMGGDVHVSSARDHVKAVTMGGDIRLENVDGWVDAATMGGRVEVSVVRGDGAGRRDVRLDSKSGDLRLTVPADFAMDVDVEITYTRNSTRRYRVISDFPLATEDEGGEWDTSHGSPRKTIRVRGRVPGRGEPARVVLRTINGDVYLSRQR